MFHIFNNLEGIRLTLDEVSKTPKRLDLRKQIECESFKYDEDSIDLNKVWYKLFYHECINKFQ